MFLRDSVITIRGLSSCCLCMVQLKCSNTARSARWINVLLAGSTGSLAAMPRFAALLKRLGDEGQQINTVQYVHTYVHYELP